MDRSPNVYITLKGTWSSPSNRDVLTNDSGEFPSPLHPVNLTTVPYAASTFTLSLSPASRTCACKASATKLSGG